MKSILNVLAILTPSLSLAANVKVESDVSFPMVLFSFGVVLFFFVLFLLKK